MYLFCLYCTSKVEKETAVQLCDISTAGDNRQYTAVKRYLRPSVTVTVDKHQIIV